MSQLSPDLRFGSRARLAALLCLLIGSSGGASAFGEDPQKVGQPSVHEGGMAHMSGHMYMTSLRSQKPGDQQKAEAIVAAAKSAMAPYQDYHKALADDYKIFLPNIPQPQYHFTNYENGSEAWSHFDPLKPTSLLYKKTAEGGYKLVGAMYTDRVDALRKTERTDSPQHRALAPAHQFLQSAGDAEGRILRPTREVRTARFHHHQGRLRGGRRRVSSSRIRMDGPRLPL